MAEFICSDENPYPKFVMIELKSAFINPVGIAFTYPPYTNRPLLKFFGNSLFLGTALLCAPSIISILFRAIAAELMSLGFQFFTNG